MNTEPAFPTENHVNDKFETIAHPGMSLRDYFAAKALQGYVASPVEVPPFATAAEHADYAARTCYAYADAMLSARQAATP